MAKRRLPYVLTETAARDFREARRWSMGRWGRKRTLAYFRKLHEGAGYVAPNQAAIVARKDLVREAELGIHPIGEHYLVYVPMDEKRIAVVALIRQVRDVPAIIKSNYFQLRHALRAALRKYGAS